MLSNNLTYYLDGINDALRSESFDGAQEVSLMLSVLEEQYTELLGMWPVAKGSIRQFVMQPFDNIVYLHLKCVDEIKRAQYDEAFKTQTQAVQAFAKDLIQKRKEENWFVPICTRLCADLRLIAKAADAVRKNTRSLDSSCYEQSATSIMECYRSCVSDSRTAYEVTKRVIILNLTNQLFRIYFRINKLNLLKPLVRAIENCGPMYDYFSMADKVTYKYYTGRKAMFDANFKLAEECLTFAFRYCHPESPKNKRLILMYLVPVKMFLGSLPAGSLLHTYDLMQFSEVAEAIRNGNLMLLERALVEHEKFFVHCGIFLMLEKLKIIVYRTLFKKVCLILGTHQIALEAFVVALQFTQVQDTDNADVACILANLIYQGKIKGYISHQHQKLVISKQTAFPALSASVPGS